MFFANVAAAIPSIFPFSAALNAALILVKSTLVLYPINENIPIITPINNTGIFMSIEGTNINIDDYGNTLLAYNTRWNPAKITTVDGNVEYISSGNYTSNTIFVGTAFGTY